MTKIHISLEQNATVSKTCKFSIVESTSSELSKHENDATIKLIIASGNVFHPNVRISFIPPQLQTDIIIRVGENNIFEEESLLILDLSQHDGTSTDELQLVGSYNQFAPRCKVQCRSIGNANIFNPLCDLELSTIKSGNIYQSSVKIHNQLVVHQENVCFLMTEDDDHSHDLVRTRAHSRGVQVNMSEVSLLLVAARKIVQDNHRIL